MPDPISSSNPMQSSDPYADDVGKVSRDPNPNSSQPEPVASSSPAVPVLVNSVPQPRSVLPPAAPSPPPSTANNNAQRTSERVGIAPYAVAGKTAAGDSVYAGVAGLRGRDPKTGFEAEVLSASVQVGAQNEAQIGLVRVGGRAGGLVGAGAGMEVMSLRANLGIHNDDGSTGFNIGVSATTVGAQVIEGDGEPTSTTLGLSSGPSAAVSAGLRDIDKDGKREVCLGVSLGLSTLGICLETPF